MIAAAAGRWRARPRLSAETYFGKFIGKFVAEFGEDDGGARSR